MSITSTYMNFPISTVGVDSGYQWEINLNAALNAIDSHNHSPGQGQQIQPSGLNINSDLSFQGNNATTLRSVIFSPQASPITNAGIDIGSLYVSGNELFYNDVTGGNQVQLTLTGSVNATSSGISSGTATAAFSGSVLIVKSSSTSFADISVKSVNLANSGNLSNQLTLQAPVLSGSTTQTLPTTPASTNFMTMDSSGNMAASVSTSGGITGGNIAAGTITGSNIAAATIVGSNIAAATITSTNMANNSIVTAAITDANVTKAKLAALGQQISSSSGNYTVTGSFADVTNLTVTITTTGRPVMLLIQSDGTGLATNKTQIDIAASSCLLKYLRDGSDLAYNNFSIGGSVSYLGEFTFPYVDVPSAGSHTYKLQAERVSGSSVSINNVVLVAYEL